MPQLTQNFIEILRTERIRIIQGGEGEGGERISFHFLMQAIYLNSCIKVLWEWPVFKSIHIAAFYGTTEQGGTLLATNSILSPNNSRNSRYINSCHKFLWLILIFMNIHEQYNPNYSHTLSWTWCHIVVGSITYRANAESMLYSAYLPWLNSQWSGATQKSKKLSNVCSVH